MLHGFSTYEATCRDSPYIKNAASCHNACVVIKQNARQVKGDDPNKKGYPDPPGWGFGVGLTTPYSKKLIVTKVEQRKTWMDLTMMESW
jgi:hypothetical protein